MFNAAGRRLIPAFTHTGCVPERPFIWEAFLGLLPRPACCLHLLLVPTCHPELYPPWVDRVGAGRSSPVPLGAAEAPEGSHLGLLPANPELQSKEQEIPLHQACSNRSQSR